MLCVRRSIRTSYIPEQTATHDQPNVGLSRNPEGHWRTGADFHCPLAVSSRGGGAWRRIVFWCRSRRAHRQTTRRYRLIGYLHGVEAHLDMLSPRWPRLVESAQHGAVAPAGSGSGRRRPPPWVHFNRCTITRPP
jgi:hypothetical protein